MTRKYGIERPRRHKLWCNDPELPVGDYVIIRRSTKQPLKPFYVWDIELYVLEPPSELPTLKMYIPRVRIIDHFNVDARIKDDTIKLMPSNSTMIAVTSDSDEKIHVFLEVHVYGLLQTKRREISPTPYRAKFIWKNM